jgi:uncharacterized protein YndB with AHSA1/START domain
MSLVKLQFDTQINAPVQSVWDTMLQDKTYRLWTHAFCPGSYFEGDWSAGSDIRFIALNEKGEKQGMYSRIAQAQPLQFIGIEHLGEIVNDEHKPSAWAGARETYTFAAQGGGTLLKVECDTADEYVSYMREAWPKALALLKQIAEGRA